MRSATKKIRNYDWEGHFKFSLSGQRKHPRWGDFELKPEWEGSWPWKDQGLLQVEGPACAKALRPRWAQHVFSEGGIESSAGWGLQGGVEILSWSSGNTLGWDNPRMKKLRPREIMTCSRSYLKVGLEPGYAPGATNEIPSLFICLTDQRNLRVFLSLYFVLK